jgi:hypothetical protein
MLSPELRFRMSSPLPSRTTGMMPMRDWWGKFLSRPVPCGRVEGSEYSAAGARRLGQSK